MSYEGLMAAQYNGDGACVRAGCGRPARWMPVYEFRAPVSSYPPGDAGACMPMGLLGVGFCDEHKVDTRPDDFDDGGPHGMLAHARRICQANGSAEPDPRRTTLAWCLLLTGAAEVLHA